MIFYPITAIINAITSTIVCIVVIARNPKSQLNRSFSYFAFSVAFWSYCYFLWQIANNASQALFWCRALMAGAIFIPSTFLHFSLTLIGEREKYLKAIIFWYIVSISFLLLDFTPLFVKDIMPRLSFPYWPTAGLTYTPFLMMFAGLTIYAHVLMYKAYTKFSGFKRNQIKYVFLGTAIGFIGGSTNYPLWYGIPIPPVGNVLVAIYVLLVAYSIAKYRLMDIRLAITRAGIFAFVYAFVLGIPFLIVKLAKPYLVGALSDRWWLVIMASGMFLASAGPFIFMKLRGRAEAALLREDRKRQEALSIVSQNILRFNRLDALLRAIVHNLIRIMQIKLAAIYLANDEKKVFILKTAWQPPIKNPELPKEFAFDSSLIKRLLSKHNSSLNLEEIKFHSQNRSLLDTSELKQAFEALKAQLIIPAFRMGNLIGFLVLGEKRSERGYSQEDVEVLMVLANHATLAIENAIFSESEKERQAVLFHSASLASLGTMASMMGHQVNNRFQAILNLSGFKEMAEMMLSEELNPEAYRKLIQQLTSALGRISEEAVKGGEVVASLRRLSKLSTEEFKVIAFKEVLDIALNLLQYKIKFNEFNFINQAPETLPPILGDSAQLGEVFLNLIDNGYDAIKERQNGNSGPAYKPQLCVKAYIKENDKYLHVEVSDNGMGIKEDFMSKIFVPFYTTKASSGKGTGLGLYVIKRIIEFHKGRISVASKYGEGTTFKLELPLAPALSS